MGSFEDTGLRITDLLAFSFCKVSPKEINNRLRERIDVFDYMIRKGLPTEESMGIGFAFQIYDTVPGEPTDIPLEQIVTETDRSETAGAETAGIL